MLEVIAKACRHALDRDDPEYQSPSHIAALDRLERRLILAKQYVEEPGESEDTIGDEQKKVAELYRLAGLIYIYRAGQRLSAHHTRVRAVFASALDVIRGLAVCSKAFPIVIIGCEASSDVDRLAVLALVRRMEHCRKMVDATGAQRFIEAVWAQDDLGADQEMDYARKLDAVMSMSRYRPSFAVSLMGGCAGSGEER